MVDVLRIIASLQMINGHTLDALLLPELESGAIYSRYAWYRGLVSVAFLLVAGMAYYLATIRRFEAHKSDPDAIRRRLRRGVDLIIIGYLLRFPYALINGGDPAYLERVWHYFLNCGVLQCIGVTLLMLEGMTIAFKRPQHVIAGAGVLATGLVLVAPYFDTIPVEGPWRFLLSYISHRGGSLFPIAPWGALMLGGVVIGAYLFPRGAETPLLSRLWRLALMFVVCYAMWRWLKTVDVPFVTSETTYSAKPEALFDRMRGITVLLAVLAVLTYPLQRLPRVFAVISGETLAVYVIHLVLLFHPPVNLAMRIGNSSLELRPALGVSLAMIVTTTALTMLWHEQKKRRWLASVRREIFARLFGSDRGDARTVK